MPSETLAAADGRWPQILADLGGIDPARLTNRHQPCPNCGGEDRFRWDDDSGPGGAFCSQCGGKDGRGGGMTGIGLLMRVRDWDFKAAAKAVEGYLGTGSTAGPPPAAKPARARKPKRPHRIPTAPPPGTPPPPLDGASMQWCYADADGAPLFWIQRVETATGKLFIHRTWLDETWHRPSRRDGFASEWPAPRPLYRLPALRQQPDAPVLMAEGEKAADAAAFLFPEHACLGWSNGTSNLSKVDWAPLAGRSVTLWPDADNPGQEAMAALAPRLLALGCSVSIVLPPTRSPADWDLVDAPGAHGWDLADATWTEQQAADYLINNARTVELPQPPEPQSYPDDSAPTHAGAPPSRGPFACLGYDIDGFYYQPRNTGQVVRLSRSSHTGTNLVALAPLGYWEMLYPGQKGVNWVAAASDIFEQQAAIGMFDPDSTRGRGAWMDAAHHVVHLGDRLICDGQGPQPIDGLGFSRFHYQRGAALRGPGGAAPLSDDEGLNILMGATRFRWEVPASAHLLCGWIVLAPICGALRWRPHLWLTASAGSGKSAILDRFVGPLVGDMARVLVGSSTEPGIRQTLRCDALPVILDEAESNERDAQKRIQAILELARASSSDSRASTVKGSPQGDATQFRIRSMFLLSSIATAIKHGADARRFSQLSLNPPGDMPQAEREQHWEDLDRYLEDHITPETGDRLLARTITLLPTIRQSIKVFTRVAANHFNSQAMGDQYGTLMAGAWHLQSSVVPTDKEAFDYISAADWTTYTQATETPDEQRCLQALLEQQLRVESDYQTVNRTVLELVQAASRPALVPGELVDPERAAAVLGRHGFRVEGGWLLISNTATAIRSMLSDTAWGSSWGGILGRLPGAQKGAAVRFPGIGVSRCTRVPMPEPVEN